MLSALPAGFADTTVASGLTSPSSMEFAPDGRLFVAQQSGEILVVKNGQMLKTPFVKITDIDDTWERGLLGVTVDPAFQQNHYVYAFYTATHPTTHNRIVRFTANGDVADPSSEVDIFDLPNIGAALWHMGGAIHFGPDGKLYVSVGDYQQRNTAQDLSVLTGKILRLNPDGSIPTNNPFYSTSTGNARAVWAYGLRNPFTTAFDSVTGRFYINNVGESKWETLYEGEAGANYGWPTVEGPRTDPRFAQPIYAYNHSAHGDGCIIGGAFYDGVTQQFPAQYAGQYFFADFEMGWIKTIDPTSHTVSDFATGLSFPTGLRVAADGSTWVLTRGGPTGGLRPGLGQLHEIKFTSATPGAIRGYVVNDVNGNGLWDKGDRRLAGWTVYLDANNNGKLDPGERKTTTDSNGQWWMFNVPAGSYIVRLLAPQGWTPTYPKTGFFKVTLAAGKTVYATFSEKKIA